MTFTYNIIKAVEDEKEEARAEGKAETLSQWLKRAAKVQSVEEFEQSLEGNHL